MKITFLEPPPAGDRTPERLAGCSYELYHFPDLANLYPFTLLHDAGHQVNYIDAVLEGLSLEELLGRVERDAADIVVIHSVILSKRTDLEVIRKLADRDEALRIFVHGPEATRVPEEYLIRPNVTVFRGEIEDNLMMFLANGEAPGTSLTRDGTVTHVPPSGDSVDLDELPVPYRMHPALARYAGRYFNPKFRGRPHTVMMASRGCSFRCMFCVPISVSFARELEHRRYFDGKPKPSVASAGRVVDEFRKIHDDGFRSVMVVDDQFLWGRERTLDICDGIRELGMEWGCLSRADFLTEEDVVEALAGAGCTSVDIGVESLDQEVLDDIRKELKIADVHRAIDLLRRHRIDPKVNIMFGTCPAETEESIEETVRKLKGMGLDSVMFSIATPFKGTEFHELCRRNGFLVDDSDEIDPFGKSMISYPDLPGEALERQVRRAYRSFYLRPGALVKRLLRVRSAGQLFSYVRAACRLFGGRP